MGKDADQGVEWEEGWRRWSGRFDSTLFEATSPVAEGFAVIKASEKSDSSRSGKVCYKSGQISLSSLVLFAQLL